MAGSARCLRCCAGSVRYGFGRTVRTCTSAGVPSTISAIAGTSTRVSVQRRVTGFPNRIGILNSRCSGDTESTPSKMSDASSVLSLPPLNPTSYARGSSRQRCVTESLISL